MIPKVIWSLWLDGEDNAPPLSQLVFECWKKLNPSWELRVLDKSDLASLLNSYPGHVLDLPPQALSDILRCRLLSDEGGVWVDASVLPVRPLDDWLPNQSPMGFFAYDKPGPDRPIASWLLAATPTHEVLLKWEREVRRFWAEPRLLQMDPRKGNALVDNPTLCVSPQGAAGTGSYPYFWFHYIFGYLVETQSHFRALWQATPKLSAIPPHQLQNLLKTRPDGDTTGLSETYFEAAHVHKLDWRQNLPESFVTEIVSNLRRSLQRMKPKVNRN